MYTQHLFYQFLFSRKVIRARFGYAYNPTTTTANLMFSFLIESKQSVDLLKALIQFVLSLNLLKFKSLLLLYCCLFLISMDLREREKEIEGASKSKSDGSVHYFTHFVCSFSSLFDFKLYRQIISVKFVVYTLSIQKTLLRSVVSLFSGELLYVQ